MPTIQDDEEYDKKVLTTKIGKICKKPADLHVIDYEKLAQKDPEEIAKLIDAGKKSGMWYLDIRGPTARSILEDVPTLFGPAMEYFQLPQNDPEKTSQVRPGLDRGFDCNGFARYYEIARDEYAQGKWVLPKLLEPIKDRIDCLMKLMNDVVHTQLVYLCNAVNLDIPELNDDPTHASHTALKLLYKPPVHEVGGIVIDRHTDFGMMTLLWYDEVTTHIPVYDANGKELNIWQHVPVKEGHLLMNCSDDLEARSNGQLHSTVHRVICPPGPRRPKNGMVYLQRPYLDSQ
ncbi:oxidoreductase [Xylariaceae sp. FL0255]|nr:oxidoreductase [Xylariaceae sp. FL0255]